MKPTTPAGIVPVFSKTAKSAAIAALAHVVRREYRRAVIINRHTGKKIAEVDDWGGEMVNLTILSRGEFSRE